MNHELILSVQQYLRTIYQTHTNYCKLDEETVSALRNYARANKLTLPVSSPISKEDLEKVYQGITGIPISNSIKNSDELRNSNSYEYLNYIFEQIPEFLLDYHPKLIIFKQIAHFATQKYAANIAYGDFYTKFLTELEKLIEDKSFKEKKAQLNEKQKQQYAEFINRIYANQNLAIERTQEMIYTKLHEMNQTSKQNEKNIQKFLLGSSRVKQVNETTPHQEDSLWKASNILFAQNFKPQSTSNLAFVRNYSYINENVTEYRFSTQGQFHNGKGRPSPLFEEWLSVQPKNSFHIYFNNLPYNEHTLNPAVANEKKLTAELNKLESTHDNIAVISFPSNSGLMAKDNLDKRKKNITFTKAKEAILNIANGTTPNSGFYISQKIKNIIFKDENEAKKLKELLDLSFKKLGFSTADILSEAEQQAVLFHFTKFELSNFIIDKIKSNKTVTYNMTCKDAIDRGGISAAYYNLVKSIESNQPITQNEFEQVLHATPALVKGRGMNDNIKIIWNAVDNYINGCNNKLVPDWLRTWHQKNALPGTNAYLKYKLDRYIVNISMEKIKISETKSSFGFMNFFSNITAENKKSKHNSAIDLHDILKNGKTTLYCNDQQWQNFHNGRLGKIVKDLEQKKIITLSKMK